MSQILGDNEAITDVVELCALLQCLGFSVKSMDTIDGNISQDGGTRSVAINCQSSGLRVVLESPSSTCSCPTTTNQENSGVWQVSGMTGGKQLDKEFGCSLLGSLPKSHRERLSKELHEIIRCIKQLNDSVAEISKEPIENKSASMIELKTPEKRDFPIKSETPTRCRSLDTLTAHKCTQPLPNPGPLQKGDLTDASGDEIKVKKQKMYRRQSTYTLSSPPGHGISRVRSKTSSPIQASEVTLLENLIGAEKAAEELHTKLTYIVREFMGDGKHDSSLSSLILDVSKISLLKCPEASRAQFASSPNLSGISIAKEDLPKSHLRRFDSASTSNLAPKSTAKDGKFTSRLRRISPNIFKGKKESPSPNIDKIKAQDATRSKLHSLFKPKLVTPVRTPQSNTEANTSLSSSKKKFSHIKSTIPRPTK